MYKGKRRKENVTQLKLGHTGLKSRLHCSSENCEVCRSRETVEHVLIRCKKFDVEIRREWSIKGSLEIGENQTEIKRSFFT